MVRHDSCTAERALSRYAWLLVALTALFAVEFTTRPHVAYPAAAAGLWLLRRQLNPYVRIVLVLVAVSSAQRSLGMLARFSAERDSLRQTLGASARCSGEGAVVKSPLWREGRFVLIVDTDRLSCEVPILGRHRLRLIGGPDGLGRGDRVSFVAQLGPVALSRQLELPDPTPRMASLGVVASGGALHVEKVAEGRGLTHGIDGARNWVRRRILATFAPGASALGRALVLGENDLDAEEQLAFQRSGLSHLLAVSGTHLVFAVVALIAGLRAVLLRWTWLAATYDVTRLLAPVGAILALSYADFAGGSGSAWRAAWMLALVYGAVASGRRLAGIRALALSLVVGVIDDPLIGFDVSFLLSAAATAGLVLIGPVLRRGAQRVRVRSVRWFFEALGTTVSAMIPCTPLLLRLSPDVTLAGLLANVVAGPLGELAALPLCLLHAIAAPCPALERGCAVAASGALLAVSAIAKASASQDWARVALSPPTAEQFVVFGLGVLATASLVGEHSARVLAHQTRKRWALLLTAALTAVCLIALEIAARRSGAPVGRLRVTFVDVGQGDSVLVDLPDGRLMLVDGGGAITGGSDPGVRLLLPILRARRRRSIDVVVLSHPHPDHFGGLLTALRQVPVREFWEAVTPHEPEGELTQLRRDLIRRGTRIRHLPELCRAFPPGQRAPIQVLGPCPDVNPDHHANDRSIVLKLVWGAHSVLLSGDAEMLEESELIAARGAHLRADLLKIGHHGSRSSTGQAWLAQVRPSLAVISVGVRNRFGHPHPSTLSRLAAAHVPTYRTDELGSIEWQTDGVALSLRTAAIRPKMREEPATHR